MLNSPKHTVEMTIFEERESNMSFNCLYLKNDIAYLGSDSRESFPDGTYNDNFQKTFVNRELKMIWSMTGLIKYKGVNYYPIINYILNNKDNSIIDKLQSIELIINSITKSYYEQSSQDIFFDLLLVTVENNELIYYFFESKNGTSIFTIRQQVPPTNILSSTGVHTQMKDIITNNDLRILSEMDMVSRIYHLIEDVKEVDKKCIPNTVGGDIHIVTMNKKGDIHTYINGVEKEF